MKEIIDKINDVMVAHLGGEPIQHAVAQDFSRAELEDFIGVYVDYFMK